MKNIFFIISLLLFTFCNSQKTKKGNIINETIATKQVDENIKKIIYIDFNQNPAEEYFFTRKYRLTNKTLSYFINGKLKKIKHQEYLLAKVLIDSFPNEIGDKINIGHTTVDVDVPDWTISVHYNNKDVLYLASGGLPGYMKNYSDLVWNIVAKLDEDQ